MQGVTPQIYLKLENLQPIGSFKVRPAANAIACIEDKDRLRKAGVSTASAGNFAQGKSYCICNLVRMMASKNSSEWYIYLSIGLAWCCQELDIKCTVFTPDHAPDIKIKAIQSYGATIVKV